MNTPSGKPRRLAAGTALTLSICMLAACGSADGDGDGGRSGPLTYVGFGGAQQEAQTSAWFEPYTEETGLEIVQETSVENARLLAQVESGNVQWDLNQNFSFFVTAECGTLFQPLSDAVDLSAVLPEYLTNDCGVPVAPLGALLTYDADDYTGAPPATWSDFFDAEQFPGQRVVFNSPQYVLEAALMADGVAPEDLYPLDVDRAFAKLDTIRDLLVFADSGAELTEQLLNGEASMAVGFSARGYTAAQTNPSIRGSWEQAIFDWDYLAIPMGAPNAEAAEELLSYIAQPEQQARFVEDFPYGITTADTDVELDALAQEWWVNNPDNQTSRVDLDQAFWAANTEELGARWTEWATT